MDTNARAERVQRIMDEISALPPDPNFRMPGEVSPSECTLGPHRAPAGPNEDLAQCSMCWSLTFAMRPESETFGHHAEDCSLHIRHESYCVGGGDGHPVAKTIRG